MFTPDYLTQWRPVRTPTLAANDAQWEPLQPAVSTAACNHQGNVRLLRRRHDADGTRFALAGKLADVCRTLDWMAAQEALQPRRHGHH